MYISPVGPETAVISRQIANAHTSFNLINTLLWLPRKHYSLIYIIK